VLHRRTLAGVPEQERAGLEASLAAEHEATSGGVQRAVDLGLIDEVIDADNTRSAISAVLAQHPRRRGNHGNIPL
jgi:acetyl-CoA/propionyl-CoA carboxylase carboxyl transferase subunit